MTAEKSPVVDLAALAESVAESGIAWRDQTADLNMNLVILDMDDGVAEHVNHEVDVLLVAVTGQGRIELEGQFHVLQAGQALVIPKGVRRSIHPSGGRFAYLSCHRRRRPLMPSPLARGDI